ncbi:flagellar protein FliT [Pseudomonas silvicola]|uniref:flagellar protein FliT n=1 Tax=Pseudomonas sp. RIT-To-2 TaxID=3462541 RepID=UPI00227D6D33|nr:flagellar protein FliT [Pseudomonas silvicola]
MSALQRIEHTSHALTDALAARDWEAIRELDRQCRACVDALAAEEQVDEGQVRAKLEGLLAVYRQLLDASQGERAAIVDEMSQLKHAHKAAKVYHLFR